MAVTALRSEREVAHCADMYLQLAGDSFLPTSREAAIHNLWVHVRLKHFVRCLRNEHDVITAWIYAAPILHEHADYYVFQQIYYAANLTGIPAVRAVVSLHDALYEEACRLNCKYTLSLGSHMDEANVFARILARNGWTRRGHAAAREVVPGATNAGRP